MRGVVYDGLPLAGVEIRLAGDGQIHVRGPVLLRAYRDGTDPKTPDGWLPTGDAGSLDDDGRLRVDGRLADLIVSGGENVWPAAIERVLRRHPRVGEVAVGGRPDPEWGERVVAWVIAAHAAEPPTLDDLRSLVKAHLPAPAARVSSCWWTTCRGRRAGRSGRRATRTEAQRRIAAPGTEPVASHRPRRGGRRRHRVR